MIDRQLRLYGGFIFYEAITSADAKLVYQDNLGVE
jgi:hypothetical protein